MPSDQALTVNPVACNGHGLCAELLPELVSLDEWGYPLLSDGSHANVLPSLVRPAQRAVAACPALALRLATRRPAVQGYRADSEEAQMFDGVRPAMIRR